MRNHARYLALTTLFAACATPPPPSDVVDELARRDPAFGGGEFVTFYFAHRPDVKWLRDERAEQRDEVLREIAVGEHDRAQQRVRELVDDGAFAREVLAFLRSPAGEAAANAESYVLAAMPQNGAALAEGVTNWLAVPHKVGDAARERFAELREQVQRGDPVSVSPNRLAWLIGAMLVEPEHARELRHFYGSDVGARWLAIRRVAGDRGYDAQRAFMQRLYAEGWATSIYEYEDLILPRAEFDGSGG